MASLRRVTDGKGDDGSMVQAIRWNEDGSFKEVAGNYPMVGCSLRVGSVTARTYSNQDWWMTTVIEEILEEEELPNGRKYCKFRTANSIYEFTT